MKRLYLFLLLAAVTLSGMAQTIGEAFYVYRNDGQFNAFFRDEVISIDYSYEDADGNTYDEIVTQIVNTADSVYKIPLSAIDSVCFVTPPTVYKQDVTKIELNLLDYIIGATGLTLKLKPETPKHIIPVKGDKLVLLEGYDVLPYGFSGIVSNVQTSNSSIDVICEQAYLEDLFDSFCSVSTIYGASPDEEYAARSFSVSGRHRAIYSPDDVVFSLGPYKINRSYEISQGIAFNGDLALTGDASFSVEVQPTLRMHTFLILNEGQGTYFQYSITGDLRVTSQSSLYGGLSYNHDFDGLIVQCPIPQTGNTVNFYFNPGLFVRADATITSAITSTQIYTFGSAFDFSSKGQNTLMPSIGGRLASSSVDMSGSIDGSLAGGAYVEIGFNLLSRELAKVCVRGELGSRLSGSYVFRNSDIENAAKDSKLYERLKASNIELSSFVNVSLQVSVEHTANGLKSWELSEPIHTWDRVPTFSNTTFKQKIGQNTSADACTDMSGDCLIPVKTGLSVRDKNGNEVADYYSPTMFDNGNKKLSKNFANLSSDEEYTLYPKIDLFGFELLASPTATLERTAFPVEITNFEQTGAKYQKDGFTHNGNTYSYKYDCVVTVELTNNEGVEDWGYVYQDPYGNPPAKISLKTFNSPYTDTRYSYYCNSKSSTVTLYGYVKYTGSNEPVYGEPHDYPLEYNGIITVYTLFASSIEKTSAIVAGKVEGYTEQDNGEVGFFYNTTGNPSSGNGQIIFVGRLSNISDGEFQTNLSNLEQNKTYYYCAYLYSNGEYQYGETRSFTTKKSDEASCPDANHPHMIDLGLPSGTKWACCNVGASAPEQYGNYYAWGETQPKSEYNWDTYDYYQNGNCVNIGSDIAGTGYDAATTNWGASWRMPTKTQFDELRTSCTSVWMTQNGISGSKFTGPNGGTIFLPATGSYWYSKLWDAGSDGFYWSSTLFESDSNDAWDLDFYSGGVGTMGNLRNNGLSVRPVHIPEYLYYNDKGIIYKCDKDAKTAYVTSASGATGIIVIPSKIEVNGSIFNVTAIGENINDGGVTVFRNSSVTGITISEGIQIICKNALSCATLEEVSLPQSLTMICDYAFNGCTSLKTIAIPDGVRKIGRNAFLGCTSLESASISKSVENIDDGIFAYCTKLDKITVEDGNTVFDSRNDCNAIIISSSDELLQGCKNTVIPSSIKRIGNSAFAGFSFTQFHIPDNITSLGENVFEGCSNLTNVNLPEGIAEISQGLFNLCI